MHVPLSDAKARLTDLVRKAEAGEDVVLTRHGAAVARIVPVRRRPGPEERVAAIAELQAAVAARGVVPGPEAARSADFLYGDDGLPG